MTTRTLKELAQEALDVQDACNLSGLAQRFAKVMIELNVLVPDSTEARNSHPIVLLWLDKFNSLAHIQFEPDNKISNAFKYCFDLTKD